MAIKGKLNFNEQNLKNFWDKVAIMPFHECWEWIAAKNESGYGAFGLGKATDKAHRISYRLIKGEIPEGMFLLHSCDNPACVNPDHLRIGTAKQNTEDAIKRGRNKNPPFMGGHNRKSISKELMDLMDTKTNGAIARMAGVTCKVIKRIRNEMQSI